MHGLNVCSPEASLLGRVVLGFPKPLECIDSVFLPTLWPSSLQWKEPNVVLSPYRSSLGWLESLKLSGARWCLWLAWRSVFFCFLLHCLLLSIFPSSSQGSGVFLSDWLSDCVFYIYSWLLDILFHVFWVPLPPLSIHLLQLRLEFPIRHHHQCTGSGHMPSCNSH